MAEIVYPTAPTTGKATPYPLSKEESDKVFAVFCVFDDVQNGLKKLSELLDGMEDYGTAGIIKGLVEYMRPAVDDLDVLNWNVRRHADESNKEQVHG